jgi:hypothetical protein
MKLDWKHDFNEFYSEFAIGENSYGISAVEENIGLISSIRVDFHYKDGNKIPHGATNFGQDALKVLAVVSNGIKQKFENVDIIYFLAKKTDNDGEFSSRVKLYSRIVDKLRVENNRIGVKKDMQDEYLFALCKTTADKDALLDFIG